jgi:hypothetical protein
MNDGLVHRRACCAEIGEFRFRAVALQDVLRRNGFRRTLIGDRALDDRPIDAPRPPVRGGFTFRGRRRRDILEAAIDDRFERIKLRRGFVASTVAPSTIAVAPFAEGLAALAAPWSALTIAPLAIARLPFPALSPVLRVAVLIVQPHALAALPIAVASIAPALIRTAPLARAALATLLLSLPLLAWRSHCVFAARRYGSLGACTASASPAAARAIAWL